MSIPVCGKEEHIPDVQGESDAGNMFADPVLEESQGSGSSNDEEPSVSLVELIESAIHGPLPQVTLRHLYHSIARTGSFLDPLGALPLLLPCPDPAARDLISLMGECGSAKEVVLAAQEYLERLDAVLSSDMGEEIFPEENLTPASQLVTLVSLYSSAIPRLKLRKKTPSETLRPLVSELQTVIQLASEDAIGRQLISNVSHLTGRVFSWVVANANGDESEISSCRVILYSLLESTISAWCISIRSSLACRTFIQKFPRFTSVSVVEPGWKDGEKAAADALDAAKAMGIVIPTACLEKPTLASLVLLAHSPPPFPESGVVLSSMLPVIIASIQSNKALDESLSVLLMSLSHANSLSPKRDLSPEIAIPLAAILPSLASAHPDPSIRHITYRTLSLVLSITPSPLRLQILTDILRDPDFPQMRVAAVGLVKEAVLEALAVSPSDKDTGRNTFTSPLFLQAQGPILFQPNPPDFFSKTLPVEEIQESMELPRLVECMALYYVLLLRDENNRTGIRNAETISNIEGSLLKPIRVFLARNSQDDHKQAGQSMALASLEVGLQRVDAALSAILRKPGTDGT